MSLINKNTIFIPCLFLSIFCFACEDDFNPKFDSESRYVLYGVCSFENENIGSLEIKLSRVYNIEGYDASNVDFEPVINADVSVISRGNELQLCESRKRTSKEALYIDTSIFNRLQILPNEDVSIRIKLPDGKLITAQTKTLKGNFVSLNLPLKNGFTTLIDRDYWGNNLELSWSTNVSKNLFLPSISVYYSELSGETEIYKVKEIPLKYIKTNDKTEPFYPAIQYTKKASYDLTVIDSTLSYLSKGKDRSIIKLYWLYIKVLEFNKDLSDYYSSIYGYPDHFSLRLDEKVYSNIVGATGVLGATFTSTQRVYFNPSYAKKFGYSVFNLW